MIYDTLALYYDQFIDEELYDVYVSLIHKYHKTGSVIDLGTGTAPLAIRLAKEGYGVSGTDISQKMMEMAYSNAIDNDVHITLFEHNILDPLPSVYDIVTMSSDVINYIDNLNDVETAFTHAADAMHKDSVFLFDTLSTKYMEKMHAYHEDILVHNDLIQWDVRKTNQEHQIKHTLKFGRKIETHIQTTFPVKTYRTILQKVGLKMVEKRKLEERVVLVCKKK